MSSARRAFSCTIVLLLLAGSTAARTYRDYFRYLFPQPSSHLVAPDATLILRPVDAYKTTDWASAVRVTGTLSGHHRGRWVVADDRETVIFRPDRPFEPGETVSVSVGGAYGPLRPWSFHFEISPAVEVAVPDAALYDLDDETPAPPSPMPNRAAAPSPVPNRSTPSYTLPSVFPPVNVSINDNPDDGFLFLVNTNTMLPEPDYLLILDNSASPIFFREMIARASDFKKQPNGLLTYFDRSTLSRSFAMDNTYTVVDNWIPNGYFSADFHDFLILPDGHALLMIYDGQIIDMSTIVHGGQPNATVIGLVIQELDTAKNVVFQWRSWDHFQITDTSVSLRDLVIDYVHANSLELDYDGNILLSSRNLDEITKINRQTGDVMWRMGSGSQNQFTLVGASEWFSKQHDARRLANGNITVFNNGTDNAIQETSVIEYAMDEVNKTATVVWEFRNTPRRYAAFTGNAQRLPNGNTLISWGNLGIVTEVRPDKTKAFEMNFVDAGTRTYRAFRYSWSGVAAAPTLWAEKTTTQVTLHFTKFGDNDVDHYNIYRSPTPGATTFEASSPTSAFTLTNVTGGEVLYCRVTAVDPFSAESPFSNEVRVEIPYIPLPVLITDFTAVARDGAVELSWQISADEDFTGFKMLRSSEGARREWISGPQLIAPSVGGYIDRELLPGESYAYTLAVVLADGSEMLSQDVTATVDAPTLSLHQNHPNPFNPTTVISFVLPAEARVEISVFDIRGALVRRLADEVMAAGTNEIEWDGRDSGGRPVGSGVYLCRLKTGKETVTRKMTMLK